MSDSSRPVSVSRPRREWQGLADILQDGSLNDAWNRWGAALEAELPPVLPTGLGAVIEARTADGRGGLYVLCTQDTEATYGWRGVNDNPYAHPNWKHGHDLEVVRVLSGGISWPA